MKTTSTFRIHIPLRSAELLRHAQLTQQEAHDILVAEVACNIEGCSLALVSLAQALQDVILIQLLSIVVKALDYFG